jgi:hypothetical protein
MVGNIAATHFDALRLVAAPQAPAVVVDRVAQVDAVVLGEFARLLRGAARFQIGLRRA